MIKTYGQRKLKRTSTHRDAMLKNMVTSLFLHERVQTPLAKAKELRRLADRTITQAKRGDHRLLRRTVLDKTVYRKLMEVLAPRYQARNGGYTQLFRLGRRRGDNAQMSLLKLIS